jgi:hypothetical protein
MPLLRGQKKLTRKLSSTALADVRSLLRLSKFLIRRSWHFTSAPNSTTRRSSSESPLTLRVYDLSGIAAVAVAQHQTSVVTLLSYRYPSSFGPTRTLKTPIRRKKELLRCRRHEEPRVGDFHSDELSADLRTQREDAAYLAPLPSFHLGL